MRLFSLFLSYIRWHYLAAPQNIIRLSRTFIWFLWHFFSVGILLRTLFAPWLRLSEERKRGFDIENAASTFLVNTVMRGVGVGIRLIFILIGILAIILTCLLTVVVFLVWIAWPLLIIFSLVLGFILLGK